LNNAYWVIPKRLLAGEYPIGDAAIDARARLAHLREQRVNSFIDLTEEGEMPAYRHLLPAHTRYKRFPIRDHGIPENAAELRDLISEIRTGIEAQRCIYLHCRAGIGRTGLTVGCFLADRSGDGNSALKELNELWRQSERSLSWPTIPQTNEQAAYIKKWPKLVKAINPQRL
jgi:protein-tyrosine phosphatase